MTRRIFSKLIYSPQEMCDIYKSFDYEVRIDILEYISKYNYWLNDIWAIQRLGDVIWCPDQGSITKILAISGRSYALDSVKRQYLLYLDELKFNYPWFVEKIEEISECLGKDCLPPIIVSACHFRSKYFLVDGFHRSLAILINEMGGVHLNVVNVFIGYPLGLPLLNDFIHNEHGNFRGV